MLSKKGMALHLGKLGETLNWISSENRQAMPVLIHTGRMAENPRWDFRPACLLRAAPPSPLDAHFICGCAFAIGNIDFPHFGVVDVVSTQYGDLRHPLLRSFDLPGKLVVAGGGLRRFFGEHSVVQQLVSGEVVERLGHLLEVKRFGPIDIIQHRKRK